MTMSISRAFPQCTSKEISERNYFSEELRSISTERLKGCCRRGFDVGGEVLVTSRHQFSIIEVGIYKRSFKSRIAGLVELAAAIFKSAEWTAGFGKRQQKEKLLNGVYNNGVVKEFLRQLLLDIWSAGCRTAVYRVFHLLNSKN